MRCIFLHLPAIYPTSEPIKPALNFLVDPHEVTWSPKSAHHSSLDLVRERYAESSKKVDEKVQGWFDQVLKARRWLEGGEIQQALSQPKCGGRSCNGGRESGSGELPLGQSLYPRTPLRTGHFAGFNGVKVSCSCRPYASLRRPNASGVEKVCDAGKAPRCGVHVSGGDK